MPEIIQLTRWFVGCMVSSRLLAWVVSSGTSLKRVRKAFTSLWSKVPWKPTVSILRLYKSSRRLPSRFRYSSFRPSDTESSCSWSGTVSFWERVSTVRSSIQKRGLTFRSAVIGSGVVADDTGEGGTLFKAQPVLRTAVSLKENWYFYFRIYNNNFILFFKRFKSVWEYFHFYLLLCNILIFYFTKFTVQLRTKYSKLLDWWIEKTDPDFRYGARLLIFFHKLN